MLRAMDTYMNQTGPSDYDLPELFGKRLTKSDMVNQKSYSFKNGRIKLAWFPEHHTEFVGKDAPAATNYSPNQKDFKNVKISIGKGMRFHVPSSKQKLWT